MPIDEKSAYLFVTGEDKAYFEGLIYARIWLILYLLPPLLPIKTESSKD